MRMKVLIVLTHSRVVSDEKIMKHEEVKLRAQITVNKFIFILNCRTKDRKNIVLKHFF